MSKVGSKKVAVQQATPKPGATQKALKAGPHGKIKNSDGTPHSSPNKHGKTDGGKGGLKI